MCIEYSLELHWNKENIYFLLLARTILSILGIYFSPDMSNTLESSLNKPNIAHSSKNSHQNISNKNFHFNISNNSEDTSNIKDTE